MQAFGGVGASKLEIPAKMQLFSQIWPVFKEIDDKACTFAGIS
ncbi:hypothetical protein [Paenibacillus aceti]|nr:hypothetical protein [Paenibacillus aceti]